MEYFGKHLWTIPGSEYKNKRWEKKEQKREKEREKEDKKDKKKRKKNNSHPVDTTQHTEEKETITAWSSKLEKKSKIKMLKYTTHLISI